MPDESVVEKLTITQTNRRYIWRTQEFPIPKRQIQTQSANVQIEKAIAQAKQGEIIELRGHLI